MRTIKFRGKPLDKRYEPEWMYGDLLQYINEANGRRNAAIQIEGGGSCVGVEIKTIGQFVGCKDLYDTEIYEGDIIEGYRIGEHQSGRWIIEVASNLTARARKFGKWENHDSRDYCSVNEVKCRVIGNIHDNPELIK